jgi:hypothetical protein
LGRIEAANAMNLIVLLERDVKRSGGFPPPNFNE